MKKLESFTLPAKIHHLREMTSAFGSNAGRDTNDIDSLIQQLNEEDETDSVRNPPIPVDDLRWDILAECQGITQRTITRTKRLLLQLRPKSLRQQVYMTCEVITEDDLVKLSARWSVIAGLFDTSGDCVRSYYRNYQERHEAARSGRPRKLTEEQILRVVEHVRVKTLEKNPMTRKDVVRFIFSEFGVTVSKRTIHRLVKERDELAASVAMPMERTRAEVTQDELREFYRQLRENLEGVLPESVVNLDEVGFSRRSRGSPLPCVIPAQLSESTIEYIQREELDSTVTLLAAVTLAGDALLPYIVAPVKSLPRDFMTDTVWTERDCVLDFSSSGFANGSIINQWYDKVFRPWCAQHRQQLGHPQAPIVLICDGFAGHTNDALKVATATDNVRLVFLPAHSSHITQPLDKFVFAVLKRSYCEATADAEVADRNGRKILRILRAFYGYCTSPMTIRASWKEVGIVGLHDDLGKSTGIQVDGTQVIARHVDVTPQCRYQRKRRNIQQDYLGNRQALEWTRQGLCPHCGQQPSQPGTALPAFPTPHVPCAPRTMPRPSNTGGSQP